LLLLLLLQWGHFFNHMASLLLLQRFLQWGRAFEHMA